MGSIEVKGHENNETSCCGQRVRRLRTRSWGPSSRNGTARTDGRGARKEDPPGFVQRTPAKEAFDGPVLLQVLQLGSRMIFLRKAACL